MTKSQDNQNRSVTGDTATKTTPDIPTPNGTSELQSGNVIGASGQAPSVAGDTSTHYEDTTSAVSMEVDKVVEASQDD
ncbi:hypothetical protein DKM44_00920 [Deinococcus irradiatisoli]|uniref:Uncharacterized protein n=1 Tax=Deinococcus irradiatisoli TaxID=2202254 RepID=A0A2Z3JAF7_9DEIO|nr:hypothetical protein [Deinococcus irradiatisoli]AWN21975.1 hypothetical protein DKM44_00920 [Deinococcus irradiatisoli]